jgi:Tol biopolymer transport system component
MCASQALTLAAIFASASTLGVACDDATAPNDGAIQVTVLNTGSDLDPDGYTLSVDTRLPMSVRANQTITFSGLPAGDHMVRLGNLASNCQVDGANPRPVSVLSGATATASISVACIAVRRLAFALTNDGNSEIYTINSNGTGATRLTTNTAWDGEPAWSPDASRLAFASDRDDGIYRIYVMNADGSSPVALTSGGGSSRNPAWSPDGQRIAFAGSTNNDSDIYVMRADGTDIVRLTATTAYDNDPAWSPDGSRIAFYSSRSGNGDIYVMNADGSNVTRLTTSDRRDASAAWSPDGTKLVYDSLECFYYYGCGSALYVMKADGTNALQLTFGPSSSAPAWSPDGLWIAFAVDECNYYTCIRGLSIVRADGTGGGEVRSGEAAQPAWRP